MNTMLYEFTVAAVALSAWVAYRLGRRHGEASGRADGFNEGRGVAVSEKSQAWQEGYFAHKKIYDETKLRPRDGKGRFITDKF